MALGVEADHKNIRPQAPYATLPFGIAEIDRRRFLNIGRGPHGANLAQRKGAGLGLILVFVRGEQQVEPHIVVEQKAAPRDGVEKTELDKDEEDRHENPDQREPGPSLVIGQDTPSERNRRPEMERGDHCGSVCTRAGNDHQLPADRRFRTGTKGS